LCLSAESSQIKDKKKQKALLIDLKTLEIGLEKKTFIYDKAGEEHFNLIFSIS